MQAEKGVYLHTEEWPFSGRQGDKEKEALLERPKDKTKRGTEVAYE